MDLRTPKPVIKTLKSPWSFDVLFGIIGISESLSGTKVNRMKVARFTCC